MERITRTLTLLEIETPNGELRYIAPGDTDALTGCKVVATKRVLAKMPLPVFIENATFKEVK